MRRHRALGTARHRAGVLSPLVTTDLAPIDVAPRAIKNHIHGEATKTILAEGG